MFKNLIVPAVLFALSTSFAHADPTDHTCSQQDSTEFTDAEIKEFLDVDLKGKATVTVDAFTPDSELLEVISNPAVTEKLILAADKMNSGCLAFHKTPKTKLQSGESSSGVVYLDIMRATGTRGMEVYRRSQITPDAQDTVQVYRPNHLAHEQDCGFATMMAGKSWDKFSPAISATLGNKKVLQAIHHANLKIKGPRKFAFYQVSHSHCLYHITILEITSGEDRYRLLIGGFGISALKTNDAAVSKVYDVATKKALE